MWTCPHCKQQLSLEANVWRCEAGHSYDRAKEGYVNLLPINRKGSRLPGDNADMINARRRVHEAQIYQPLAQALQEQVLSLEPLERLLDLGCGEGYYSKSLVAVAPQATVQAVDISRPAVRLGAKRCPEAHFAVASAAQLPLADASIDLVTSIFAPVEVQELLRVLQPAAYYLKVTPGPRHLWALREALYAQPRPHAAADAPLTGFELLRSQALDYELHLAGSQLADLIAMTPFAYRGDPERRQKLCGSGGLDLNMSFSIALYRQVV